MKQITLTEEEARAVVEVLRTNWIPLSLQRLVYNLINKLERELES